MLHNVLKKITGRAYTAALLGSLTTSGFAASPIILLDWNVMGVEPEYLSSVRPALTQTHTSITDLLIQTAKPIDSATLSRNKQNLLQTVRQGEASDVLASLSTTNEPLVVEPVLCSLKQDAMIMLIVSNVKNQLRLIRHQLIPWNELRSKGYAKAEQRNATNAAFQSRVETSLQAVLQAIKIAPTPLALEDDSGLHLNLALMRHGAKEMADNNLCLNLLLAEQLATEYAVLVPYQRSQLIALKDAKIINGETTQFSEFRHSRHLLIDWFATTNSVSPTSPNSANSKEMPPDQVAVNYRIAGSILSHTLVNQASARWQIQRRNNSYAIQIDPQLRTWLQREKAALQLKDMPQISKVYRAWVYVDRGRAWGLEIGDRLLANTSSGESVKGHVVRYFGPEEGLTSPRGFPIHDGAIIYIRKNQHLTYPGLEFRFDDTTYPTMWPPPQTDQSKQ